MILRFLEKICQDNFSGQSMGQQGGIINANNFRSELDISGWFWQFANHENVCLGRFQRAGDRAG